MSKLLFSIILNNYFARITRTNVADTLGPSHFSAWALITHFDNAGCKTHCVCTEKVLKMFQEENILVEFKVAVSKGILC